MSEEATKRAMGWALLAVVAALFAVGAALFAALRGDDEPAGARAAATEADDGLAAAPGAPRSIAAPDTLLMRTPAGDEVWWTLARRSVSMAGEDCVERSLEIRRGADRIAVPLLYSGDLPELVDDTTMEVSLWKDCAPGRIYRVDLRTGQPAPAPAERQAVAE